MTADWNAVSSDWVRAQASPETGTTYRHGINEWFGWCDTNHVQVWDAQRRDVDAYRNWVTSRARPGGPLGEVTLARVLATMASFYRYAMEDVDPPPLERSPLARVKRPRIANVAHRHSLTLDEARGLLTASVASGPRNAALVHLLLSTAVRVSEACSAETKHLGWNEDGFRSLTVTRKGGVRHEITIQPPYWEVIDHYLATRPQGAKGGLLLTQRGLLSRQEAFRIVSALARQVVPLKQIGPHSLRHTAATLALDEGVPIQEVQGMLGHSDSRTTTRYDRNQASRGRAASRVLGDLLAGDPTHKEAV